MVKEAPPLSPISEPTQLGPQLGFRPCWLVGQHTWPGPWGSTHSPAHGNKHHFVLTNVPLRNIVTHITDMSPQSSRPQRFVKELIMANKGIPRNKETEQTAVIFTRWKASLNRWNSTNNKRLNPQGTHTLFHLCADAVGLDCAHTLFPSS